jgi:3-deoxy-7-phosphoheptulonate synthase
MIVLLQPSAGPAEARAVEAELTRAGSGTRRIVGRGRIAVEAVPPHPPLGHLRAGLSELAGVEAVLAPDEPLPKVTAAGGPVNVSGVNVGGPALTFAFGPCAVENEDDLRAAARAARRAGAQFLRGGAFKPRTSPYAFQGLGHDGLRLLRRVADDEGLRVVSEATSEVSLSEVAEHCDLIQLGARSMGATPLLRAAARAGRPILLKRHFGATVDEWLAAAEYLLDGGAPGVILCERGIRSFEPGTRATLVVGGLALARLRTGLPILADPSHAAGTRPLVRPLALAAVAAGADGLIVEAHADPARARSDGPQALTLDELQPLAEAACAVHEGVALCSQKWLKQMSSKRSSASPR